MHVQSSAEMANWLASKARALGDSFERGVNPAAYNEKNGIRILRDCAKVANDASITDGELAELARRIVVGRPAAASSP